VQERPELTVSNPNAPEPSLDVVGDDAPHSSRPLLVGGLVVLLLLLLVLLRGGAEIRDRRAAEQEERRLQAVVELETTARFTGQGDAAIDPGSRLGTVSRAVGVRNAGPRDVTVSAATLGDLRLDDEVVVPAGQDVRLRLSWQGACTAPPALLATSSFVELEVRTQAGPQRTVLPLPEGEQPPAAEDARRACGYLSLEEATGFHLFGSELVGDTVLVDVEVINMRITPVRLVAVRPGAGLSLAVQTDVDEPVSLPLELAARSNDGDPSMRRLRLVLQVTDCAAIDRSSPAEGSMESALGITSVVGDEVEESTPSTALFADPGPLLRLLEGC
jgi:hypothetical protein